MLCIELTLLHQFKKVVPIQESKVEVEIIE